MKNNLVIAALVAATFSGSLAFAKENKNVEKFSEHKAKVLSHLNEEKSVIDGMISCVSGSSTKNDLEKCREEIKERMDKIRKARREEKRSNLQNRLDNFDKEESFEGKGGR